MNGAIVYAVPGPLAQLHQLRDAASAKQNWRLCWALTIVIAEVIGVTDESIRNDIDRYYRELKISPR